MKIKSTILAIIIILLVSCQSGPVDEIELSVNPIPIPSARPSATAVPIIVILDSDNVINFYDYSTRNEEDIESFASIIKERFGIDLQISQIPSGAFAVGGDSLNGIISLANYEYSELYKRRWSLFQPLNEYLADNEIYQSLPSGYKNILKDDMGLIWCLPGSYDIRLNIRVYSEKLLKAANSDVPKNVDELSELFAKIYALENSKAVIMRTKSSSCIRDLYDILDAYGLQTQNGSTIIYNKSKRQYEDSIYNADTIDLLGYIRFLQDNNYLIVEEEYKATSYERALLLSEGNLATYTTSISYAGAPSEKYSFNLLNNKQLKTLVEMSDTSMIFMGKNTDNPSEALSAYLNTFYNSNEANIFGTYGESGHRAVYSDSNTVKILNLDVEKALQDAMSGKFVYTAGFCGMGYYNDYFRYNESMNETLLSIRKESYMDYLEYRNKGFEDGIFDILSPLREISDQDRLKNKDILYGFRDMMVSFLNENISIEDFNVEYQNLMKRQGQEDFLNSLNERLLGY